MKTLYKEGLSFSLTTLIILLLVCVGLFVGGFFTSAIIMIIGMLGFFVVITIWSIGYYSAVTVTEEGITVGKDAIHFTEINKTFGVQEATAVLSPQQLETLEVGLKSTREGIRILGGAYGRPKTGAKWLAIKKEGDSTTVFVFSTRHREEVRDIVQKMISDSNV